jgi:hypothetical protein
LEVIVEDLENVKNVQDAQTLLVRGRPSAVVFAAGSFVVFRYETWQETRIFNHTTGSMSNPAGVDRDAAKRIMKASTGVASVAKFLFISFPAARRKRAPWWSEEDYHDWLTEKASYPRIYEAKLDADEYLVALANARVRQGGMPFQAISLRPTWLTNGKGTGRVRLGKASCLGQVTREDVAAVAVGLLSRDDTHGWFDLFQGEVPIGEAISNVVRDRINCFDGEDLNRVYQLAE